MKNVIPNEEWRDIPGYEGLYQVSSIGRVKSLPKDYVICNSSVVHAKEKILRPRKMHDGYIRIELNHNGVAKQYPVHRLVAMAFIENPENKPHIDHLNTIKDDNRVENLRWVTPKENFANPVTRARYLASIKHRPSGKDSALFEEKSPDSKAVLQYDKQGKLIARYACCHQVGRKNEGYNYSNIARVCRGERLTYKGYIWKYEDGTFGRSPRCIYSR